MNSPKALSDAQRAGIFLSLVVSCVFTSFLTTAMTAALPVLVKDLDISVTTGQWLTSGYSLAMGIVMPLTAFLIRRFNSKKLYLFSLILFVTGSLCCALSGSFALIMAGRIMQAVANGLNTALTQVVLLTIYPRERQGTVMGWYGLAVMTAPVLAPTLAGFIIDSLGWRWIFYLIAAVMALSALIAAFIYRDVLETCRDRFDTPSFLLSVFAFGGLTLGIGSVSSQGITDKLTLIQLAVGLITAVFFVRRQLKLETPFLDLRILKNRGYTVAVLVSIILYFTMMGSSVIMPLYVQNIMGRSAVVSGLVTLPGSLASAFCSPVAGKIYDKMGIKKLLLLGGALLICSNAGMVRITMATPIAVPAVLNVVRCISIASMMMPLVTWGIGSLHDLSKNSHGSALLVSLRTVSGAVGSAVFVGIMNAVQTASAASYGANAAIHGLNTAFLGMTSVAVVLFLTGIFLVPSREL